MGKSWGSGLAMQNRQIIRYTMYFLITAVFASFVVIGQFINLRQVSWPNFAGLSSKTSEIKALSGHCRPESAADLNNATSKYIQKLNQYQQLCSSKVADKYMIFTSMPNSKTNAEDLARRISPELKAMRDAGVQPVVIVEPTTEWGLIDFTEFASGFYDAWIKDYFSALKKEGLSDKDMGIWVPFPEANLPYWNRRNATPKDYAQIVNRYTTEYKRQFPQAKASILLNSATYESDDFDWAKGDYLSLLPYVSDIKPGLIDSFGLQGFPWSPPATQQGNGIFDAREFLNSQLAIEAARKLGVKEIWFNTGTYVAKYAQDDEKRVSITASKRKDVSYGIVNEVGRAQEAGFSVWVNIFAEDKSRVAEATDWSYMSHGQDHQQVFFDLVNRLNSTGIGISLYDIQR